MADQAGGDSTATDEKETGRKPMSKATIVLAVVALLAVGAAAKTYLGGGGEATAATAGAPVPSTTTTTVPGPVVAMEPITLNVAGGRFLKVGLAFQLAADHGKAAGGGHGGEEVDPVAAYAEALDLAIEVLGGRTYDQLVTPEGRDQAKAALTARLQEAYHGKIEAVYFTEFVMQ